ncbi:hypothetical protein [Nocardia iowensis]|uniref:Uncharacterized protein n=1 Tax=Nocardia iowensis TaxID=204891 RepID=A0ABX8RZ57_NOCIO|nr:hypothetical protein [Nocardia iowensis]QXN94974.1 hypothetical protein KV110_19180 [Nocardia iowensis]
MIDRFVVDALGWNNGDRLCWQVRNGIGVISRARVRSVRVPGRGHLWLPTGLRHAARLGAGDRVFLAAATGAGAAAQRQLGAHADLLAPLPHAIAATMPTPQRSGAELRQLFEFAWRTALFAAVMAVLLVLIVQVIISRRSSRHRPVRDRPPDTGSAAAEFVKCTRESGLAAVILGSFQHRSDAATSTCWYQIAFVLLIELCCAHTNHTAGVSQATRR